MKVVHLGGRYAQAPKAAGIATLEWSDRHTQPERADKTITLPAGPVDFFPLQDGQQFLALVWNITVNRYYETRRWTQSLYFGGTDEQPFLVELDLQVLDELAKGEERFYAALKPEEALTVEQHCGYPAKRQGDWFAVPLSPTASVHSLLSALQSVSNVANRGVTLTPTPEKGISVRGTRHAIHRGWVGEVGSLVIAEGTLSAPDHQDLELSGPHALFQTAFLINPRQAD